MTAHLSAQQTAAWIIGEQPDDLARHLSLCPICQGEVQRLEGALGGFRSAVRHWSDYERPLVRGSRAARSQSFSWLTGLSWAAAALIIGGLATQRFVNWTSPQLRYQEPAITEAALLGQIDRELSKTVPGPMQPLTMLVSWEDPAPRDLRSRTLHRAK